jgi:hypothetical protein
VTRKSALPFAELSTVQNPTNDGGRRATGAVAAGDARTRD